MFPSEHIEILVNDLTPSNRQVIAEGLSEAVSAVLQKIVQREIMKLNSQTKLYLQKEKSKKSCEKSHR